MNTANAPLGPCRLRVVNRDMRPQPMCATYQGAGKPVIVAPDGPQQLWEVTLADQEGGYNIRAIEVNENLDQAFMHNDYKNSSVLLGSRHFLRIGRDKESDAYTISGPYRAGTYGANDWIGVIDGKLVTRTMHEAKQTDRKVIFGHLSAWNRIERTSTARAMYSMHMNQLN